MQLQACIFGQDPAAYCIDYKARDAVACRSGMHPPAPPPPRVMRRKFKTHNLTPLSYFEPENTSCPYIVFTLKSHIGSHAFKT